MIGDKIPVSILMAQVIANLSPELITELGISDTSRSIGLLSTDCDDATYIALDEATKTSNVEVVYAKSLYAGASNASTRYAGEVIGILAGPTPSEVISGMERALDVLKGETGFQRANEAGDVVYLSHCVSRTGTFLSKIAGIPVGHAVAYLVASPVEAIVGIDAALKASDVTLAAFFSPPTETNFAGALLTGSQSACMSACNAFSDTVIKLAQKPVDLGGNR